MRRLLVVFLAAATGAATLPAAGQDPFGGPDPFGTGPAAPPAAAPAAPRAPASAPATERDPAVLTILESNPQSPADLVRAIDTLLQLRRGDVAKRFIKQLLDAAPPPDVCLNLVQRYGSGYFFRLARDADVQPEGAALAQHVLDGAYQAARDPQRVQRLIAQLNDPARESRLLAIADLRGIGAAAVNPLLAVLTDPARSAEHGGIRYALGLLTPAAAEPLIAALDDDDPALKIAAIEALGGIKAQRAVLYLMRPYASRESSPEVRQAARAALENIVGSAPSPEELKQYLRRQVEDHLAGRQPFRPDLEGRVTVWRWDAQRRQAVPDQMEAEDAARMVAARAATDLYAFWPDRSDHRRLYLRAILESAKHVGGLGEPLAAPAREEAAALGREAVEDLLDGAMRAGQIAAAIAAAEVLGDLGDAGALQSADGRPRPLAEALIHPDRRVRFAAASAVMRIDPVEAFPGSSRLPEALGYFAATAGTRRVLVGHPQPAQAQSLAGMLIGIGIDADTAFTGRDLAAKAIASPDYELLLISDAIDRPPLKETVQLLRKDWRTAALPIGMMVQFDRLEEIGAWSELDPLTEAFPRPHETESLASQMRQLIALVGRNYVPLEERVLQAEQALRYLGHLADSPQRYRHFDLLRQQPTVEAALFVPPLTASAAQVLGRMGSPAAQRALVLLASQNARPLGQRQAASAAFAEAVRLRGVLLTTDEIRTQYDRYNQSERLDRETQEVLASILDTIESAAARKAAGPPGAEP